jgi:proteasome assembly chaperone (PAC2) family protein
MSLVNELIKGLLPEEEKKKVVAVYGGGFKPPTSGHFEVVQQALKENPEIDEFIILIGGKPRNGITPDESILIWDIYKQYLPYKVEVKYTSVPPIKGIYNYAKEHPDEEVLFIIGAREGNEEDFKDIASRTTSLDKYPNLNLRTIVTTGGVSGTAARNASKISLDKFKNFVPSELSDEEVEEVFNIVANKIQEKKEINTSITIETLLEEEDQLMAEIVNPDGEQFQYEELNIKGLYTYEDSRGNLYFARIFTQPTNPPSF